MEPDEWIMEVWLNETKVSSFTGTRTLQQILNGVRDYLLKQRITKQQI